MTQGEDLEAYTETVNSDWNVSTSNENNTDNESARNLFPIKKNKKKIC